jgi:hypothetical protein
MLLRDCAIPNSSDPNRILSYRARQLALPVNLRRETPAILHPGACAMARENLSFGDLRFQPVV